MFRSIVIYVYAHARISFPKYVKRKKKLLTTAVAVLGVDK